VHHQAGTDGAQYHILVKRIKNVFGGAILDIMNAETFGAENSA
jgi:hypothetical protein